MNKIKNYFMLWLIPLLTVLIMIGCDQREELTSPPITTIPTVSATNPENAAAEVPFNQQLTATFSEEMDSLTITTATFTLMQGTSFVSGTVSYTGTTAAFAPSSNLTTNTTYTATITTMAKNLAGNALADNYIWSFTTGSAAAVTPPSVSLTDPVNAASGVPINQKIAATFSVEMDATTITSSTFTLLQGTTPISGFVSYSGITAIFAPTTNLLPNTAYTGTITTGAKNLAGNALVNNYIWSFTTGATAVVTPPTVSLTDPENEETNVPLNQKVAATFSKTMDATTITSGTFTLKQGTTSVSGFTSYSGTTAIFAPASNLSPNTVYTATITAGATDLAGNALENDYAWSFTTGAAVVVTPPIVSSTDPANIETGVPVNQKIQATFSKTMNASTLLTTTFILTQGITSVSGFVTYSGITATFSPAANLMPNTVYTATITTGAEDLAGNALENNYEWSFTTGATAALSPPTVISTVPADTDINVPLNQKVSATFSKTMNASTMTASIFTLKQGTTSISGFVSYSGTTAIFAPANNLDPNTVYTGTITTGAKDLAGNALENDYVWSFTTGSTPVIIPPTIVSTDPDDTEICVALDKSITASFSKPMNASTITTAIFTLMRDNVFIAGTVSYIGTTATYNPTDPLLPNATYTATITTGARDLTGTSLDENYVWSFTTVVPYTVNLSSNPSIGGTTNGGGTFNSCSLVTVTASPNSGYEFVNWTENGNEVSTNTNYQFTLEGNRSLVANFNELPPTQYSVSLSSSPALGGTTSGGGTFDEGTSVTVTATANAGYDFTNWTEGGLEVSANASYTFNINANRTFVANFEATSPSGQAMVELGTAARFAILSNSDLTNVPTSSITGDVGISPGLRSNITGFVLTPDITGEFSTDPQVNGGLPGIYAANDAGATPAMLIQAKADAEAAYLDATSALRGTPTSISGNINGLTLVPGLYESGSSIEISPGGSLTLDAGGDATAVFILRSATSITTSATSQVILAGSANPANIFWVAGSAITLGTNSIMKGTLIASTSISLLTGSVLEGRALIQSAAAGQVSLDQATIVLP